MKLIIAGSRTISHFTPFDLKELIELHFKSFPLEIVSGCAKGADQLGIDFALIYDIDLKKFPAQWEELGKKAGFVRNQQMAEYADYLLALWDGKSRGTRHMIQMMINQDKPFHVELCE